MGADSKCTHRRRLEATENGKSVLFSPVVAILRKGHLMSEKAQCVCVGKGCLGKRKAST